MANSRCYLAASAACPFAPRARIGRCHIRPRTPLTKVGRAKHEISWNGRPSKFRAGPNPRGITPKSFRFELEQDIVVAFGKDLRLNDKVVLKATGNTAAIIRLLTPFVVSVVIAKVDAPIIAQLHAAGLLPEIWTADDDTLALRRFVSERVAVVRSTH